MVQDPSMYLIDGFERLIYRVSRDRSNNHLVDHHGRSEPAWVLAERIALLNRVNWHRDGLRLPPVGEDDIRRVEDSAAGHSDYVYKLAVGCAQLSTGRET